MNSTSMLYATIRPLLFRIDPETTHELAMQLLGLVERLPATAGPTRTDAALERRIWGLRFPNPVGLAAGFDKSARLPHVWQRFGFGFAELGTITALPQSGNPKPRLFRLREADALINRLGFNNDGAEAVAHRLGRRLAERPVAIPLGINIGKSAAVALADAPADYRQSYQLLAGLADYVTINVSSPNTKGLRDLQAAAALSAIVDAVRSTPLPGDKRHPPLLIKVAPDLDDAHLRDIVDVALECGVDGLIATNTTVGRDGLPDSLPAATEAGGLSGRPLTARSTAVVRRLRSLIGGRLPIIGVGGIFDGDDAFEKIEAGADLVQMYTGFVYGGPTAPRRVIERLLQRLEQSGFDSVEAAVGSAAG